MTDNRGKRLSGDPVMGGAKVIVVGGGPSREKPRWEVRVGQTRALTLEWEGWPGVAGGHGSAVCLVSLVEPWARVGP